MFYICLNFINYGDVSLDKIIYLDNSSTTKPCQGAVREINRCLTENWGNPSSLHLMGFAAETEMTNARIAVSKLLHCREDEIFFTSGGTEANNIAILGAVSAGKRRGNRIVTTAIEHPSVLNVFEKLKNDGFEVVYLHPDENGTIPESELESAINKDTILVSMMLVNNEVGSVLPVEKISAIIKKVGSPALIHCDAVQGFGKMPIDVKKLGVQLLTLSGHKIHGPKGVGVLFKAKGVNLKESVFGGGQEKGLRSGTEGVPAICGLLGAVNDLHDITKSLAYITELNSYARSVLTGTGLVKINSPENALPYILNISVSGYKSETLLHFLESKNIFVSSGSACSKGVKSYVLREMGINDKEIDSSLRISFCKNNTKEEIDILANELKNAAKILKRA